MARDDEQQNDDDDDDNVGDNGEDFFLVDFEGKMSSLASLARIVRVKQCSLNLVINENLNTVQLLPSEAVGNRHVE